jgi:hypothetical protein
MTSRDVACLTCPPLATSCVELIKHHVTWFMLSVCPWLLPLAAAAAHIRRDGAHVDPSAPPPPPAAARLAAYAARALAAGHLRPVAGPDMFVYLSDTIVSRSQKPLAWLALLTKLFLSHTIVNRSQKALAW